jgi:preprotein translocase subunit SecD
LWKVILILVVLVGFAAAMVPTNDNPEPIRRGLDLKGGTHLVMRVNVGDAVRLETDQGAEMLKGQAKKANLPIPTTRRVNAANDSHGWPSSADAASAAAM